MDFNQPGNFKAPTTTRKRSKYFYISLGFAVVTILVLAFIGAKVYLGRYLNGTEIDYTHFARENINGGECYKIPSSLESRCYKEGGVLEARKIGLNIGAGFYRFGCYPVEDAKDYNKNCSNDKDCEGWCLGKGGDIGGFSYSCSRFKKPYFAFGERDDFNGPAICDYDNKSDENEF